jgi:hypothetical protein
LLFINGTESVLNKTKQKQESVPNRTNPSQQSVLDHPKHQTRKQTPPPILTAGKSQPASS